MKRDSFNLQDRRQRSIGIAASASASSSETSFPAANLRHFWPPIVGRDNENVGVRRASSSTERRRQESVVIIRALASFLHHFDVFLSKISSLSPPRGLQSRLRDPGAEVPTDFWREKSDFSRENRQSASQHQDRRRCIRIGIKTKIERRVVKTKVG